MLRLPIVTRRRKKMAFAKKLVLAIALAGATTAAYGYSINNSNRRDFLSKSVSTATAVTGAASLPKAAIADDSDPYADYVTTESGLKYKVTKEGTGAIPSPGQTVKAHYTG